MSIDSIINKLIKINSSDNIGDVAIYYADVCFEIENLYKSKIQELIEYKEDEYED